jgi:hypothetical protein
LRAAALPGAAARWTLAPTFARVREAEKRQGSQALL